MIELARLSPSAANLQNLRFWLVYTPQDCQMVFPHLKWANYLRNWEGPMHSEQPSAYIMILSPSNCTKFHYLDAGIACQSILLGAVENGYGGCIIASVDRDKIHQELSLPEGWNILLVIALGVPTEKVVIEDMKEKDSVEYWRDSQDVHHVPKRTLESLILSP
jgi:nitroreductase